GAQTIERITFEEAVRRATANNPTVQEAVAGILRAEALLQQVRSRSLPALDASVALNVVEPVTRFDGTSIFPVAQTATRAILAVPLLTPVTWAQRNQAKDQVLVAQATAA